MTRESKRRRRKNLVSPEPIEDLLARAGEDRFSKRRAPIPPREWRAALGPRIADRAQPMSLERGVLVVKVATSVWANELQMLAPELIARLKERGFNVESLRFRTGSLDVVERPPERRTARAVPPRIPLDPSLRAVVAAVPDAELRDTLEQAARANLAWQSFVGRTTSDANANANANAKSASGAPRDARAPRGAGRESAPPDRSAPGSSEASPGTREGGSYRRR